MSRRRVWGALAGVLVLLAAAGAAGWVLWGDDLRYRHSLVKYSDDKGEPNRYVNLEGGDAQLAIGSPDRHRIVVQWRDPDGHGWTAPETVWTDEKDVAVDNTVRYGGGTVVAMQQFTPDVHNDSDIGMVTVGIVCRELVCTAGSGRGFGSEAQVSPDGRSAYLGQDKTGVELWTHAEGIHLAPWSGHPGFEYGLVSPSEPVLAPDGSLRVVTSEPSRGSCTFELLTAVPGTAHLTSAGRTTERLRGGELSDCASYLLTYSSDWVEVHPSDHRSATFWFVRDGGSWTTTRDDPSGLRLVDHAGGCCATSVIGFVHWNDVAFGSPDGHAIQVQTHLLGDEAWSEPVLLDAVSLRDRCTWLEGYAVGDGFAVLMTCHSGKVHNKYRGDSYAVAVTPDLRHWDSAYVTGVSEEPQVDADHVQVGDTTWTPADGFVTR
jgi:hypothetical protein